MKVNNEILTWGNKCRTASPRRVATAIPIRNVKTIEKPFSSLNGATKIPTNEPTLITRTETIALSHAEI